MSNSSELFSYNTTCSSFKWIEPLFFELSCTQTDTQTDTQTNRIWFWILLALTIFMKVNLHNMANVNN